jgi:hypothetical protein
VLDEDVVREYPQREIHFDLFREDWHRQAELAR